MLHVPPGNSEEMVNIHTMAISRFKYYLSIISVNSFQFTLIVISIRLFFLRDTLVPIFPQYLLNSEPGCYIY